MQYGGSGGDSILGLGGQKSSTVEDNGTTGSGYGAGGSGSRTVGSSPSYAGGNGTAGVVIVTEYYS